MIDVVPNVADTFVDAIEIVKHRGTVVMAAKLSGAVRWTSSCSLSFPNSLSTVISMSRTSSPLCVKVTLNDHDTDPGCVADTLVHGGVKLIGLEEEELGLEEVFMRVTRGETQ